MLVLSRKPYQEIVINGNIRVEVLDVRGDRVKLGITAPAEIPVHRAEVYARIADDPCGAAEPSLAEHRERTDIAVSV